ncbi:MAG: phosphate ABC transporter substrate-binding protein [Opitutaceae bacterium]|nr:phosphate ABC transporter substrate-binding protein [Opitutaceae bacterium]
MKSHLIWKLLIGLGLIAPAMLVTSCKPRGDAGPKGASGGGMTIQNKGSDTMVNVAQVWAEEYKRVNPQVDVEVSGGGSGVGIAALIKGTIAIANASREMKPEEIEQAKKNTGKEPKEIIVGYDALAVYVHRDNPINEITNEQLAAIFAEGGKVTKWSEMGLRIPGGGDDIVRVSRQSSSGTYEFFREHILNKKDFKLGSRDMNGSKEVVELVASTPTAIGYSGMGYNMPGKVKMLKVAPKAGQPAVEPTVANTLNKNYPIARSLQIYTLGEPQGELKKYVDWILGDAGQHVVEKSGYVPLPPEKRRK